MLELTITTDGTLITIDGLFIADGSAFASIDEGNGEIIQTVTLKVWKGCDVCSNCTDEAYLNEFAVSTLTTTDDYTSDASGDLILNSTTFLQTTSTDTAALSDTVYHVDVYIDGIDDDTVTFEQKYSICVFVDSDLKCRIIKSILSDNENDDLVNIHNALMNASECSNCCKVCELHAYLVEVLDNLDNCTTC